MRNIFIVVSLLLSGFGLSQGECQGASGSGIGEAGATGISIAFPSSLNSVVNAAINDWNSKCTNVPTFMTGTGGGSSITITFTNGNSPSNHLASWHPQSRTISLYSANSEGNSFSDAELTYILTHELGHVLGLGDVSGSNCLMGPAVRGFFGYDIKNVSSTDCSYLRSYWRNLLSISNEPCINQHKTLGDCNSPIVIDLGGDGFGFGGFDSAIYFDLYGFNLPVHIQWVLPGENDAFLVHDLNGNGLADDGSELFGNGTRLWLEGGRLAKDGFEALRQYDQPDLGGDLDGAITHRDQLWTELWLWTDSNADGISTSNEMQPISFSTMSRLLLQPRKRETIDEHGNFLKFWSLALTDEYPVRSFQMVDVFFKGVQ